MNNFEQKREVAKRCVEDIGYVVNEFGERNAGSDGEKRTAEYYKKRPCVELVGDAAGIIENYLQNEFPPKNS